MINTSRRIFVACLGASAISVRQVHGGDVAWRIIGLEMSKAYKPLPRTIQLADCSYLEAKLRALEGNALGVSQLDVDRFRAALATERPKLAKQIAILEADIRKKNKQFDIQSVNTIIGCLLGLLGLVVTSQVAIGALVGISLLSVVGLSSWSLISNSTFGSSLLIGYGTDKTVTLVGIVLDTSKRIGPQLASRALSVLGPLMSAREALEVNSEAAISTATLNALRSQLREFDNTITSLSPKDDKALLEEVIKPIHQATITALRSFIAETKANNCMISSAPQLRRP